MKWQFDSVVILILINTVALHRAWDGLPCLGGKPPRYITRHLGQLSLAILHK